MNDKEIRCEICGIKTQWNQVFFDKINEQGVKDFPNLEKDVKATIINNLKSQGIPIMLNPDGTKHICKTNIQDKKESSMQQSGEFRLGEKIKVWIKDMEHPEEYEYIGVSQFSEFSSKFLKLKNRTHKVYIKISEIQKIEVLL